MKIALEAFRDIEDDIKALIEEQAAEIDTYGLKASPNWDKFRQLEDLGQLICLGARDPYPLVGYCVSVIHHPPEYSENVVIQNSSIYVKKEYRSKGVGKALVFQMETIAYERYADAIVWHTDIMHKEFGDFLQKNNYTARDVVYTKQVK